MLFVICLKIFLARIIDVSLGSIRTILMVKGQAKRASIIAFFEVFIWFIIAKEALNTEIKSLLIPVFYAGGYATGTLLGIFISDRFADGVVTLQVIITNNLDKILKELRDNGYGLSIIDLKNAYEGKKKKMLIMQLNQKSLTQVTKIIKKHDAKAFIVINETKYVQNGLIK